METYGIEHEWGIDLTTNEWRLTCISPFTIAYSCGTISRPGQTVEHNHDPTELDLCQKLSAVAASLMEGIEVGMGSAGEDYFLPFFITANRDTLVPEHVTEDVVRHLFGGTINPIAKIAIEPLDDAARWWQEVRYGCGVSDPHIQDDAELRDEAEYLYGRWLALRAWFHAQPNLHGCAFLRIGEPSMDPENSGASWPRLIIGITEAGSVVGLCGWIIRR